MKIKNHTSNEVRKIYKYITKNTQNSRKKNEKNNKMMIKKIFIINIYNK
jgi:hypothetical protein